MPINFRQLEVFQAVAETRSFTRASHRLFISQSTVSQHIRELEETLKVRLFDRNQRNVNLTKAGANLLEHCRQVFQLLMQAEKAAQTIRDPYSGKVSFGCAASTLLYHLPSVLAEYAQKYPNVDLNIMGGTIQEVASQMWAGELDLAMVVLPLAAPELKKVPLFDESFVAVIPADHPLAAKKRLHIGDLAGEKFVLHRASQNTRKLIDRFLFKNKVSPRVAMEIADPEAIKAMVRRGFGVTLLPASAFGNRGDEQGLKAFPIGGKDLRRSLALVYPRLKPLPPPAVALAELLQSHFGKSGLGGPSTKRQP